MKMFPILFTYYKMREEIAELRSALCVSMVIALPWPMIEAHERQAQTNHGRTIARLAERGGLSACEACAVLEDRRWQRMPQAEAHTRLKDLFMAWQRATANV